MRLRVKNPTRLQWVLIGTATVLTVGATTAYAASRRRSRRPVTPAPAPEIREEAITAVGPEVPDADPLQWRLVTAEDPGYPWEFAALHYENHPIPGTWVDAGDRTAFDPANDFDLLVRTLLASALTMAGNDYRIAHAVGKNPNADLGRKLRRGVREALTAVGGVNDLLYGQTNLNLAGGNDPNEPRGDPTKPRSGGYVLNAQGRGLNWLPRHADNLDRIQLAQSLKRTTALDGRRLPPPDRGSRPMRIWAPAFDLDALAPDEVLPTIKFGRWSDGSSTIDPPPAIQALGVDLSGVQLRGI